MNELTSRNSRKSTNILEIKVDNKIVSNPMDIAETINDHFTNVAQVLAQDIAVVDINPESYLEPTDHSFSPQIRRGDIVSNILLNSIFSKSILKGIYPIGKQPKRLENNLNDRKRAKVTPLFKKRIT